MTDSTATWNWEALEILCPACFQPSVYYRPADRMFHLDGTTNDPCWSARFRGETL